jgi:molecular chaperone GrpE
MDNKENTEIIEETENTTNENEIIDSNLEETNSKKEKKEGKFFKKKDDKLHKQIETLEESNKELKDKYLRLVAEYDNYRKRTAKERIELSDLVRSNLLLEFLPIVDDIDRAIQHLKETTNEDFSKNIEGVQLIADKFHRFLANYDITEIESMGKDFDVDVHEAVTKFPVQNESEKGKVVNVIQTGYKMKDKVIRFAKVVVGE